MSKLVVVAVLAGLGWFAYGKYQAQVASCGLTYPRSFERQARERENI
jgi:hypothetical protein